MNKLDDACAKLDSMLARADTTSVIEAARTQLEKAYRDAGAKLKAVAGVGSGSMGQTPDTVKSSVEYKAAKRAYDDAFAAYRQFNTTYKP